MTDYKKSIASGILVGIGVITSISVDNKYISAMLFSFALLSIILFNLPLYTGKIGYFRLYNRKTILLKTLIGNLSGILLVITLMVISDLNFYDQLYNLAIVKFSKGYIEMLIDSFFCGILMFVAVHSKDKLISIFCIMIFILSGFEHCIADFPYLMSYFSIESFIKFILIILGNSLGSICAFSLIKEDDE